MATRRRVRFVTVQVLALVGVALLLSLLDVLTFEWFFTLSLIVFLLIVELTSSVTVIPPWRRRVSWFVWIGLGIFAVLVTRRMIEILPPEILPW